MMNHSQRALLRPITPLEDFEKAFNNSDLTMIQRDLIEYIRYVGIFDQVNLCKALKIPTKPPALSVLCESCRKIGKEIPEHFESVREWSLKVSEHNVHWDGNLVCSTAWNYDGERLSPESGTTLYHTFSVHKELFIGLN